MFLQAETRLSRSAEGVVEVNQANDDVNDRQMLILAQVAEDVEYRCRIGEPRDGTSCCRVVDPELLTVWFLRTETVAAVV